MPGFEELDVWKRSVALSISIYKGTTAIKDFGFRDQITRSGLSVPSNIAEGLERSSPSDRVKFLEYARASCGELRTQVTVGAGAGFIEKSLSESWIEETKQISAMIQGLIKSIRNRH